MRFAQTELKHCHMPANEHPESIHGKSKIAPLPPNEAERLLALRRYHILDTAPEAVFDDLTRLAAQIMGASTAILSLLDADRQWFKSKVGLEGNETSRDVSFCAHAILQPGLFLVEDATLDERFANHPRVVGKPFIRFYAGFPLLTPEGLAIGTFCVMDTQPRRPIPDQIESLRTLAHQVMAQLELRRNLNELSTALAERQQAKAALEISEAFFLTLVENLPQNIFRKDVAGRFTFANQKFCKALGKPLSEIVGQTDFDIFPHELAEKYRRDDLRLMAQREPLDTVEVNQAVGQEKTHVHVIKTPILDVRGEAIGIVGIFWDVSERIRMQEALAYERDLLRVLLDHIPDRIYFKDTQSRFLKCSNTVVSGLGISRAEEAVGKSDFDFFTEEHARPAYEDEQAIIRTGQPLIGKVEKETWIDGTETWALTTKMPLHNKDGQIIGTFGITKDVTEMKRIEADLAFERDQLRSLMDSSPDRISFKDTNSRFIRCSRALAKRLGLNDPKEVEGKTDFDFHTKERAQEFYDDEQRILATGQPIINKVERQLTVDGKETWASVSKVPIFNQDGKATGLISVSRDITQLKLTEQELGRARDVALESTRLKSEFLANMSHEIRTPMNAIIGMTGLLLETEINDEQRDFAETVRSSADALLTIINDILDFSKVEAGKLTFESIDFDLCDAVESTVELLAERSQNKGLELASWIHTDVPTRLRGDPGRIRQILTNLVGNAIKFTEQGEVVVRVTKELETEMDTCLRFEVTDTGIGIPEAALPRMFLAFTQADGSMTRKYGGTGLGLAICKQLVELMGGQIGVRSQVGKGSAFWFTARLEKQSTDMPALPSMTQDGLVGLRVLVVDDNFTNRQIVHHQILSWRMRNGQAASGAEALAILRREAAAGDPYDLAILDMQMPEMDGLTLARAIKSDPTIAATKMMVLTSLGLRIEPSELKAAGIAAYLVKPVKQSRLFDCIAVVMTGEKSEPSAPKPAPVPGQPVAPPKVAPKNVHILLAEDNPVNQKVALRQLQKLGYAAAAVANGLEVLDALKQIPYAVILMDCQMPEMDGYEATRQIRQLEYRGSLAADRKAPVQIVAMTAHALRADREKCLESGMDDYISKPVVLAELETALNRALGKIFPETPSPAEAAPPASTADVLDAAVLAGLRELREPGQPDPLAEVANLFLQDSPPRLAKLKQHYEEKDASRLERVAHSLKGSAGNLGARRLAGFCADLEKLAQTGKLDSAGKLVEQVGAEYQRVQAALEVEKKK